MDEGERVDPVEQFRKQEVIYGRADQEISLIVEQLISHLKKHKPKWADVIICRFLVGLTIEETAQYLDIAPATVKNHSKKAIEYAGKFL
jgi:DNA-directed RNA polymerase specialized sigma24 family protein